MIERQGPISTCAEILNQSMNLDFLVADWFGNLREQVMERRAKKKGFLHRKTRCWADLESPTLPRQDVP
jgi:hypothetical protein